MDIPNANESLDCRKCGYSGVPKIKENPYTVTGDEVPRMHITALCGMCGAYIKHLPQNKDKKPFQKTVEPVVLKKKVTRYEETN